MIGSPAAPVSRWFWTTTWRFCGSSRARCSARPRSLGPGPAGAFSADHDEFWTAARRRVGDQAGTRAVIEVLLAHRQLPAEAIRAGIRACLDVGVVDPDVVIVEARRAVEDRDPVVVPIGVLTRYDRPTPTIAHYDQLLKEAR